MATDATSTLNDLIQLCLDGKNGYQHAADHASDATLKSLFTQYASQRAGYASELTSLVSGMGGTPADSGTTTASLHRAWIGLKDAVTTGDGGILSECIRGEKSADESYEKALDDSDVPANAMTVVSRQHAEVEQALSHMRSLIAQYGS